MQPQAAGSGDLDETTLRWFERRDIQALFAICAVQPLLGLTGDLAELRFRMWWDLGYLATFLVLAGPVFLKQYRPRSPEGKRELLTVWLVTILFACSLHAAEILVFGELLRDRVTGGVSLAILTLVAVSASCGRWLYANRAKLRIGLVGLRPARGEAKRATRCLIVYLSKVERPIECMPRAELLAGLRTRTGSKVPTASELSAALNGFADISNWLMPLESIRQCLEEKNRPADLPLKVVAITSRSSSRQAAAFAAVVRHYFPNVHQVPFFVFTQVEVEKHGVSEKRNRFFLEDHLEQLERSEPESTLDSTDIADLWSNLNQLIGRIRDNSRTIDVTFPDGTCRIIPIEEEDMLVDFTGGKKTASVVAVLATVDRPVRAKYILTASDADDDSSPSTVAASESLSWDFERSTEGFEGA